jgi:hypothetical protein
VGFDSGERWGSKSEDFYEPESKFATERDKFQWRDMERKEGLRSRIAQYSETKLVCRRLTDAIDMKTSQICMKLLVQ